jgi:hypothetical protein
LKLLGMSAGQLLVNGSAHQTPDFVTKLFDLRERRISWRTVRAITHCCHRCHAIRQLLL